jgi:hypothetical protein
MPDLLFPIFTVFFVVFFIAIFAFIVWAIFNQMRIAARNRASALLSREARLVGKRQDVHGGGETRARMSYYATFEFTDGSREEFGVTGEEYGLLAEGDRGILQSQGTWYKGFERF